MTPTHGPRIAAIYARVSTTEQADKGWSLPTQLEACVTLARQQGYTVPESHIFQDDYTGTSLNRPQFLKLRELVRQRLVSAVIVHDLDRLSRKLAHQLLLSEEFEQAGVTLHIVTMPDGEKTPETQLLANVRGIIAEYERAKFLERSKRGLRGRAQAGFTPGGAVPLGYRAVQHAKGTSYAIAPEEAALVQRIFSMYVGSGHSLGAIALQLTQEGIVPPGTRRSSRKLTLSTATWHKTTVRDILRSATYLGTVYYGKTTNLPGKSNPDKKTRHGTAPQSEWIAVPVPPIIDETIFQAAQQQLRINAEQSKRNRKHEYLFTGKMLRCRQCGASMGGVLNGQGLRHYRCNRPPYQRQDRPHRRRNVKASALEPVVWQAVETALRNPALIAQAVERRRQDMQSGQGDLERERCSYEGQLARCANDLKRWEDAYLEEVIDLDEFKAKKAEVDARRASVQQELDRVDAQQRLLEQAELETISLVEYCQRVHTNLQRFDLAEQRRALAALNITVVWHPDMPLEITGSIPVEIAFSTVANTPSRSCASSAPGLL